MAIYILILCMYSVSIYMYDCLGIKAKSKMNQVVFKEVLSNCLPINILQYYPMF